MAQFEKKNFITPDDVQTFPKGKSEVVRFGTWTVRRATFEPGWKWSDSIGPIAKTESCQATHHMYVLSGHLHIAMDDGSELETGPGDAAVIPPGHDAWTVGSEACVFLDVAAM